MRFEVMGNPESTDNIPMKLLVLLLLSTLTLTFSQRSFADSNQSQYVPSDCYKPNVNLKPITGLARTLQFDRKGCLVEEILTRRMKEEEEKSPNGVTEEQARRVQNEVNAEACVCLTQKGVFQKNRYRNLGLGSENSWMDDIVWKRMGDHFKGKIYENFNKMLQLDVLLKRGDINENYMMFAPKCRIKAITEQIGAMKGKKGNGYDCSNSKLFDKRLNLILGTTDLNNFKKTLEKNLRKVVENKISAGSNQCLTYKSYLSSRSPSSLRFEILDVIKMVKGKHPKGSQELKNALSKVHQFYQQNYANIKPGTSNNPLYNEAYLQTILGEDSLESDWRKKQGRELQSIYTGNRKTHQRNMRELQGDPFLKSLLEDPNLFMNFANSEEPELAFHNSKNIQTVFEDQNHECAKLSTPEFIGRMFCEPKLPPLDMHLIVNDISPEAALNSNGENYFDSKINEYMTARHLCYEERHLFKKNKWKRKKQDFENDGLIHEVLNPKNRLVSELETLSRKGTGDPRLQDQETSFEKLNKQMCPLLPKECQGSDMTSPECNNIESVLGAKQSMAFVKAQLDSMQIAGSALSENEKAAVINRIHNLLSEYKDPNFRLADGIEGELPNGKIESLKEKIKNMLIETYGTLIESRTGESLGRPINPYSSTFREQVDGKTFYKQLYGQVDKLVQGHTISEGRKTTIQNQRVAAVIGHYEEEIKAYYAGLEGDQKQTITDSSQISRLMLDSYFQSKDTSLQKELENLRGSAPSGSGLARLLNNKQVDPVVTNETGAAGSNYFTDYFLAANNDTEEKLASFRNNIDPTVENDITSRGWAPLVGPTLPSTDGTPTTSQGIPYTRNINSDNPVTTIVDTDRDLSGTQPQGPTLPLGPIDTTQPPIITQPLRPINTATPIEESRSLTTSLGGAPLAGATFSPTSSGNTIPLRGSRASSRITTKPYQDDNDQNGFDSSTKNSRAPASSTPQEFNRDDGLNELRDTVDNARLERNKRAMVNQGLDRAKSIAQRSLASARITPNESGDYVSSYRAPDSKSYVNPYTSNAARGRLPSDMEGRVATGQNKNESKPGANDSPGSSSSRSSGQDGAAGSEAAGGAAAQAGGASIPVVPGFEGKSISNCAIPTLVYTMQCYIPNQVFNTWSYLDEFSSDDELKEARENPSEFVAQLGLEGKAFVVVQEIPQDKSNPKDDKKEKLIVTTYDYFPEMLEDVDKMGDEKFRNDLISKILANRWNFLEMRNYAKNTKILEQTVYDKNDFLKLMEERKLKPMIGSVAEELYENVAKMNLRSQRENQEKVKTLRSELASRR